MTFTVTRERDMLVIRIPIKTPTLSASGKTLVVASTRGNQNTAVQIDGKDLYLGERSQGVIAPLGRTPQRASSSRAYVEAGR